MTKRMMLVFLALSMVILVGHAGAQDAADVNGTWVGSTLRGASTLTLVLQQSGNNVTGTLLGAGTLDGPLTGTVNGDTIRLWFDNDYEETPLLNVKGNEITGMLRGTTITLRRTP
ncbi:MAG TPA: hypothetical protein VFW70_04550 [Methylomirabilota bacterium]|nr:hypothetical protein [Methylomirabilota bacterium]